MRYRESIIIFILFFLINFNNSLSQIVIHDTLNIKIENYIPNKFKDLYQNTSNKQKSLLKILISEYNPEFIEIPKDGKLNIFYSTDNYGCELIHHDISNQTEELVVRLNGHDSDIIDNLNNRFDQEWSTNSYARMWYCWPCPHLYMSPCMYTPIYYKYTNTHDQSFEIGEVSEGDSLQLFWNTSYFDGVGWDFATENRNQYAQRTTLNMWLVETIIENDGSVSGWWVVFYNEQLFTCPAPPTYEALSIYIGFDNTELKIIEPDTISIDTLWITNTPQMPGNTCKAVLLNYNGGQVTYNWRYKVKYSLPRGWQNQNLTRQDSVTFNYTTVANNSDTTSCFVDFVLNNDTMFIGGEVTIFVDAVTPDSTYRDTLSNGVVILGRNPSRQQARANVDTEIDVIMYEESMFMQFYETGRITCDQRNVLNYPLFGPPDGRGICQIEFSYGGNDLYTRNEMTSYLWNWQDNRERGVTMFEGKRTYGIGYPQRLRDRAESGSLPPAYLNVTDFNTQEEILKEAFQLYNGGHQWRWYPDDPEDPQSAGSWLPRPGRSGYGDDVWQYYFNVINNNPPDDWN